VVSADHFTDLPTLAVVLDRNVTVLDDSHFLGRRDIYTRAVFFCRAAKHNPNTLTLAKINAFGSGTIPNASILSMPCQACWLLPTTLIPELVNGEKEMIPTKPVVSVAGSW
jgi:hypothetical protein